MVNRPQPLNPAPPPSDGYGVSQQKRHCPRCRTQVEDVGGYCLLGHRLNETANTGTLSELRAEVDRAFEDAKIQVAAALQGAAPPPPPMVAAPATERPASAADLDAPVAVAPPSAEAPSAVSPPSVGIPLAVSPPSVEVASLPSTAPSPTVPIRTAFHVDTEPVPGDPIVDFAPAPRMDWGPERQGLLKRLG